MILTFFETGFGRAVQDGLRPAVLSAIAVDLGCTNSAAVIISP